MQHLTVHTSLQKPIVVVTSASKFHVTFTKYWVTTTKYKYCYYENTLHRASCKIISNVENSAYGAAENWSKTVSQSKSIDNLVLLAYSPETAKLQISAIPHSQFSPKDLTPEQRAKNYSFATDPQFAFTWEQARTIWILLNGQGHPEPTSPEMEKFLSLYPNANNSLCQLTCEGFPNWPKPLASFPTTMEEALKAYTIASTINSIKPKSKPLPLSALPPEYKPDEQFAYPQPTETAPAYINIANPINCGYTLPRNQPAGIYMVWVQHSAATSTKLQREVIYAKPLEESPRNPRKEAFPLCSPKSTIALLFWDANQLSPTYGQPIVRAINHNTEIPTNLNAFLNANQSHFSQTQNFTLTPLPALNQPTEKEISVSEIHCKYCNTLFSPNRPSSVYCSPSCRIDYNAGKVYGQEGRVARIPQHIRPNKPDIGPLVLYGIKFPSGHFYAGAQYTENGIVHSKDFVDMPWRAKSYSPAKIQEMFALFPKIFEGCVMEEIKDIRDFD